jgi:hypothetical protein
MLVPVILGGRTYWDKGVPCVRGGYLSEMDDADLVRMDRATDTDVEETTATEYWLDGELVHRSVNMRLKTAIFAEGIAAKF